MALSSPIDVGNSGKQCKRKLRWVNYLKMVIFTKWAIVAQNPNYSDLAKSRFALPVICKNSYPSLFSSVSNYF